MFVLSWPLKWITITQVVDNELGLFIVKVSILLVPGIAEPLSAAWTSCLPQDPKVSKNNMNKRVNEDPKKYLQMLSILWDYYSRCVFMMCCFN